jgi:hypothetical protein
VPALGPRVIDQSAADAAGEASDEVGARRVVWQIQPGAAAFAGRAAEPRAASETGGVSDEVVSGGDGLERDGAARADALTGHHEPDRHAVPRSLY